MTGQQQRIFFVLFFISIILFANVAGETVNEADKSAASQARISEPGRSFESNGTTSASNPKARDKNVEISAEKVVQESIVAGEDETDDETAGEEDEYEGEDEADEYAEELRAAAESHEAMSRHDKQGRNQSNPSGDHRLINPSDNFEPKLDATKKDFDSREKSVESGSDESESSNETVLEGVDPEDEEVTELIKYKSSNNFKIGDDRRREESVKRKRVPTVKKELSTQTEIKTTNVSKVDKRFSTKEMLDELNKQFKYSVGYTEKPCDDETTSIANEASDKIEDVLEVTENDDYFDRDAGVSADKLQTGSKLADLDSEELEEPRKLDKRQEAVLRDLEAYLRAEYAAEQEQQQKLQELGAQEGALAESLLELLVKLAENPRRWERVHRLLMDVEGGLELSRQALEARKRAFNITSVVATTTTTSPISTTPKKPRKKPKKKKKKQRHHRFSTTTTTVPTTVPILTTTESPWLTTPMQWRLVAERLFGPPWPQDLQDDPGVAKVRFTVPSNSRTSPPSREFIDQLGDSKQLQDHKVLNTERQALMLESSREYTQPRHLHYGKVNTHQGAGSHRESSAPSNYHPANRDAPRVRDYDPPERTSDYDMARYGQYDYPRSRIQGEEFFPVQSYAQNHEYRPPGREYAASKSWHDAQYKYGRPSWKSEDRSVDSSNKWTWPQLEEEPKTSWHRVPNEREYWPRVQHENEEKVWPQSHRSGSEGWGRVGEPDSWTKTSWPGQESPKSQYARYEGSSPPWENAKSRSESPANLARVGLKDATPKIGMKGWNGLASDQAVWPFKITETKQWQKDSGEKSYGQNSPLVTKLGLENGEKEAFEKSLQKDIKNVKNNGGKYKTNGNKANNKVQKVIPGVNLEDEEREQVDKMSQITSWNTGMDTNPKIWPPKTAISPKIQSVGAWVMPVDQSTWKPYKLKAVDQFSEHNEGDPNRHRWNVQMDTNPRTWPPKMGEPDQWNKFGKPNNGVTWPKWKQFAYHRVTAMPILSQGASLQDGSRARNNAYIAVSAVSPKYNGNQWRKNDIEETPVRQTNGAAGPTPGLQDAEHPVSQLRGAVEPAAIYTWKKDGSSKVGQSQNLNGTDPLEEQLETLRRGASWSHNENRDNIKKQLTVISDASETLASRFSSNSSANKPEETEFPTKDGTKGGKIDQDKKVSHK